MVRCVKTHNFDKLIPTVSQRRKTRRETGRTGCADDEVNGIVEPDNVVLELGSASGGHDLDLEVFGHFFGNASCLQREFS